jgi:hypothetical protein
LRDPRWRHLRRGEPFLNDAGSGKARRRSGLARNHKSRRFQCRRFQLEPAAVSGILL